MRILFVTSTRIGDAVLSSGLLHHLVTAHPGAAVTVACGPPAAPLFEAVPGLERLIVMAKKRHAGHWFRLWGQTAGTWWDRIVDVRGSPITMLLPHRWRRSWRSVKTPEHRVMQVSRLIGLDQPAAPYLYVAERHREAAAKLLPSRRAGTGARAHRQLARQGMADRPLRGTGAPPDRARRPARGCAHRGIRRAQ